MIILLGSKNQSKEKALMLALKELKIVDYKIISFDVSSDVNSKPIGYDIIKGATNRNKHLKELSIEHKIKYDYLCSIEGGYTIDESGMPIIVTYCVIEDKNGNKSTGKSLGLRLTKRMYEYIEKGYSLNQAIEKLCDSRNNKQNKGITGYLSNGIFNREKVDKDAVLLSFISFIYSKERDLLDKYIIKNTEI